MTRIETLDGCCPYQPYPCAVLFPHFFSLKSLQLKQSNKEEEAARNHSANVNAKVLYIACLYRLPTHIVTASKNVCGSSNASGSLNWPTEKSAHADKDNKMLNVV